MAEISTEVIDEITRRIIKEASPRMIVLFGSAARGVTNKDSDVDVLVVEDEPFGPARSRFKEIGRVRHALRGLGVPIDLLVFSREEMEAWSGARSHVVATALREGKVLYDRS